jgi:hypothetical protein
VNLKTIVFCALAVMASPAAAEPWGPYASYVGDPRSLHEIRLTLRAAGLHPVSAPVRTGQYYVVRAVDRGGSMVRVVMDARFGNIASIVPLPPAPIAGLYRPGAPYPAGPYEGDPRYGAVPPDFSEPTAAPPPVGTPMAGAQGNRSAAGTAARPPLPRPRPAVPATVAGATTAPATSAQPPAAAPAATASASAASKPAAQSFPPAAALE